MKKIKSAIAGLVFVVAMTGAFAFTSVKFSSPADYFNASSICSSGTTIENSCSVSPVTIQCTVAVGHTPKQAFLLGSSCLTPIYKH